VSASSTRTAHPGPTTDVVSVRPVVLPAPARGDDLEVRVCAPATGAQLPVLRRPSATSSRGRRRGRSRRGASTCAEPSGTAHRAGPVAISYGCSRHPPSGVGSDPGGTTS